MAKRIEYLIVHCSGTPEGRDVTPDDIVLVHRGAKKNADGSFTFLGKKYTLEQLKQQTLTLHSGRKVNAAQTNGNGWVNLGYTNFWRLNGDNIKITANNEDGMVDTWEITNGVAGVNDRARHVCYAGGTERGNINKAKDTRTPQQIAAMTKFIKQFVSNHPRVKVGGHDQFVNGAKACPSFCMVKYLRSIGIPEGNIYNPKKL